MGAGYKSYRDNEGRGKEAFTYHGSAECEYHLGQILGERFAIAGLVVMNSSSGEVGERVEIVVKEGPWEGRFAEHREEESWQMAPVAVVYRDRGEVELSVGAGIWKLEPYQRKAAVLYMAYRAHANREACRRGNPGNRLYPFSIRIAFEQGGVESAASLEGVAELFEVLPYCLSIDILAWQANMIIISGVGRDDGDMLG